MVHSKRNTRWNVTGQDETDDVMRRMRRQDETSG